MKKWNIRKTYRSEYSALKNAVHRCHKKSSTYYADYGGRGIKVADEFRGPDGFLAFFLEIGPKPSPDHTLERIDNDDGYRPGNITWSTRKEQIANRRPQRPVKDLGWGMGTVEVPWGTRHTSRRKSPLIEYAGETLTLYEWADRLGLERSTLRQRFAKGWPLDACMASHLWTPHGLVRRQYSDRSSSARTVTQDCIELLDEAGLDISKRRH